MKVKTTVLVRSINQSGQSILKEISGQELKKIFLINKKLPKEERRYFMVSRIREGDVLRQLRILRQRPHIAPKNKRCWRNIFPLTRPEISRTAAASR